MANDTKATLAMTIRAARPAELDRISDIINDPPNAGSVKVAGSVERAIRGGRVLARAGLILQLSSTVVAETDSRVIGVMDAGTWHNEPDVTPMVVAQLLVPILRAVGPGGLWRLLRSRPSAARVGFPTHDASYYIAELDIDPAYRNRGIGGQLLSYGEAQARAAGAARMTLTTGITNIAQHLYARHGFRIVETKRDAEYERWTGSPGRVFMVKDLG